MDPNDAWMAGLMEGQGTFFVRRGRPAFALKSTMRESAVHRFAELAGLRTQKVREGVRVTIQGDPLHELMRRVWPMLTRERQKDYARVKRQASSR